MKTAVAASAVTVLVVLASACASYVLVPPRIALDQDEVIGVIEFSTSSEGRLGEYVTDRFLEEMRRDQGVIRTLDLGTEATALASVHRERLDPSTFRTLGDEHNATTILRGELEVSDVRPAVSILGLAFGRVAADIDARLSAELIETATGAAVWNASGRATRRVGEVSVFDGGRFVFDADDPETAYGELIDVLVQDVALDFQATWVRGGR